MAWTSDDSRDRFTGTLLGLAVGDAVGTTVEFKKPGEFEPVTDMVGGGPFGLKPGQWTDDTSLALCLAESLVECRGFDPADQMRRYLHWWKEGYWSSTGKCFDIGGATEDALGRFERTGEPYCGTNSEAKGNGSLMRLAPVPLFYARDPGKAIERSGESSRTTHGAAVCVDACRYFGAMIVGAIAGRNKGELLSERFEPVPECWAEKPLTPEIDEVACGSFRHREPPEIEGRGYVVNSMEAALWAFHRTDTFRDGCLAAVNLGRDADTTAAIYGQLAGAYYGARGIPEAWRERLTFRGELEGLIQRLWRVTEEAAPVF
jgi:ADP-ribosylglycohydrolase